MTKRTLIVVVLAALGFGSCSRSTPPPASSASATPAPITPRKLDVDAMAARMKIHQDVYQRLRDNALRVYATLHPSSMPQDEQARTAIRLAAYLWVWDDYYKEGLWQAYLDNAKQCLTAEKQGDSLLHVFYDLAELHMLSPAESGYFQDLEKCTAELEQTDYPAEFKFAAYANLIGILSGAGDYKSQSDGLTRIAWMSKMTGNAGMQYEAMARAGVPDDLLYDKASSVMDSMQGDEKSLTVLWMAFDKALENGNAKSTVRPALQGAYYIDFAWLARGTDYSSNVTTEGWQLFKERLARANEILQPAYAESTIKSRVASSMITVVLGQGGMQVQMEAWFQRAILNDPDGLHAYRAKMTFLLPRWYGTQKGVYEYGLECVKTGNWSAKTPMILTEAVDDLARNNNPDVYELADVWKQLEIVYREYLKRYPDSTVYRSQFAKCAAQGKRWRLAKEQFDLLGDQWSREVFTEEEYEKMSGIANQAGGGAGNPNQKK